ncbi:peptidase, T1 family [Ancylostoma ceylanicum]|uniref:Proteasome subunit beta n=1 Tax=Ancylostoma ceylanicum TaxID=53326 RepID=A0A0D6LEP8_9BILA|nr:peptidase, T1 family [Ancylostoma ceylanicum]
MLREKRAVPTANNRLMRPVTDADFNMDVMEEEKREAIPALGFYPHEPISTGTTLIAMEFKGGVVVGTDSRTSAGSFISSRATNKITPITDHMAVCRSGSAADTQAIADIVKYHIELYAIPLGGFVTRQKSTASGSGSTFVQGFLDNAWKPNLTKEECKAIVKQAVGLAVFRDGSSGGVVRVATIDKTGTKLELFRPDKPGFPGVVPPSAHLSFPPHLEQAPVV